MGPQTAPLRRHGPGALLVSVSLTKVALEPEATTCPRSRDDGETARGRRTRSSVVRWSHVPKGERFTGESQAVLGWSFS